MSQAFSASRLHGLRGAWLVAALLVVLAPAGCVEPPSEEPHRRPPAARVDAGEPWDREDEEPDAGVEPPLPGEVAVATFNVHNFFDTVCDSGRCGPGEYEALPSMNVFNARAAEIAAAITRLDASVVVLQELENQSCLDALTARLPRYRTAVLGEVGTPASVDVAILSEHPLLETRTHRATTALYRPNDGSRTSFARELLELHLQVGARRMIVFAAHFKAKANDDPGRRLAEAQMAREIALASAAEFPEALVVLGGDLNDEPGSPPLQALLHEAALLRVASDLPANQDATYTFYGEAVALDHLLHVVGAGGAYVPGTAQVFRDAKGRGWGGSDHAALRARFLH